MVFHGGSVNEYIFAWWFQMILSLENPMKLHTFRRRKAHDAEHHRVHFSSPGMLAPVAAGRQVEGAAQGCPEKPGFLFP